MVEYTDIQVRGSVQNVQTLVQSAFSANEFAVAWAGPTKGKAEKGSKGMNIALGALAQYYAVDFEIHPDQGGTILRLHKGNSGLAGGLWGMSKVNKQFTQLGDTLASWFQQQGILVGVKKQ